MARACFGHRDTVNDDAAAFGLRLIEDQDAPERWHCWPENEELAEMFEALQTQWDRNPFTGKLARLRYEGIPTVETYLAPSMDRKAMFYGLQIMEQAVLTAGD